MADLGYRPMGFETDTNNPNFVGAANPDSLLHCEFYWHIPLDRNKTDEKFEETGKLTRIYGEKQPYVRIMKPGDANSIIETPVREDHKRRWPEKWLYFQIQEGLVDAGQNQPGWKVEEWEDLTQDEIHKLKFQRFYTVEQIAGASDAQIMGLGMGGLGLRKKAQQAISNRVSASVKAELAEKDRLLLDMQARLSKMEALMNPTAPVQEQPAMVQPSEVPPVAVAKKKYVMTPEHKAKLKAAREAKKGK